MRQTKVAFQVSQEAAARTTMVVSTMLATAVTGGALQSLPMLEMAGAATWAITVAVLAGSTTVGETVFLSVVSRINLFDYVHEGVNLENSF